MKLSNIQLFIISEQFMKRVSIYTAGKPISARGGKTLTNDSEHYCAMFAIVMYQLSR